MGLAHVRRCQPQWSESNTVAAGHTIAIDAKLFPDSFRTKFPVVVKMLRTEIMPNPLFFFPYDMVLRSMSHCDDNRLRIWRSWSSSVGMAELRPGQTRLFISLGSNLRCASSDRYFLFFE